MEKNQSQEKVTQIGEEVPGKRGHKVGNHRFVRESGSLDVVAHNDETDQMVYKFTLHPKMDQRDINNTYADVSVRLSYQLISN